MFTCGSCLTSVSFPLLFTSQSQIEVQEEQNIITGQNGQQPGKQQDRHSWLLTKIGAVTLLVCARGEKLLDYQKYLHALNLFRLSHYKQHFPTLFPRAFDASKAGVGKSVVAHFLT